MAYSVKKFNEARHHKRRMLRNPTKGESQFSREVCPALGIKPKKQKIVMEGAKSYILDFYLSEYKLAIEIDGRGHDGRSQKQYDEVRTSCLARRGIRVVRFRNDDLLCPERVMAELGVIIEERKAQLRQRGRSRPVKFTADRATDLMLQEEFMVKRGVKRLPLFEKG